MEEVDWDLFAIVRSCGNSTTTTNTTPTTTTTATTETNSTNIMNDSFFADFPPFEQETGDFLCFPDLLERKDGVEELDELYKPFLSTNLSNPLPPLANLSSPIAPLTNLSSLNPMSQSIPFRHEVKREVLVQLPRRNLTPNHTITPRPKRRKNQQKKVVRQVPAEGISSDNWAWRKYGQKPIKGSPYPRGYYRCSSSKGCLARKQVERSRTDPGMFILTYTAEHNHPVPTHRNSLAGSTRQKVSSAQNPSAQNPTTPTTPTNANTTTAISKPSSSSPLGFSPTITTSTEEDDDELLQQQQNKEQGGDEGDDDDEFGMSQLEALMSDDLFMELDELMGPTSTTSGTAPAPLPFASSSHWFSAANATAAGGVS